MRVRTDSVRTESVVSHHQLTSLVCSVCTVVAVVVLNDQVTRHSDQDPEVQL
jgi:hypothetical protein